MLTPGRSRRRAPSLEFVAALGFALVLAAVVTYWIVR